MLQCNRQLTWPCLSPRGELSCVGSEFICDGKVDCLTDKVIHMSDEHGCREYTFRHGIWSGGSHTSGGLDCLEYVFEHITYTYFETVLGNLEFIVQ